MNEGRFVPVVILIILLLLAAALFFQAAASAAQAAALLGAQILTCLLGAGVPAAFYLGYRAAGGTPPSLRLPELRKAKRLPESPPQPPAVRPAPAPVRRAIMEILEEWWR